MHERRCCPRLRMRQLEQLGKEWNNGRIVVRQKVVADVDLDRRSAEGVSGTEALCEPRSVFRRDPVARCHKRGGRRGKVNVKKVDLRRLRIDDYPIDRRQPGGKAEGTC